MGKRVNYKGIKLNRTIGIEIEGYTKDYERLRREGVRHSQLKRDASLYNSYPYCDSSRPVGVEVVTVPINELDMFDKVFEDIKNAKWNIGRGTAGTHIHVDVRDYNFFDKMKMAIFMSKLEEVMFMLVKPYRHTRGRYRNRYCGSIDVAWERLYQRGKRVNVMPEAYPNYGDYVRAIASAEQRSVYAMTLPSSERYDFVNVWNTGRNTIEFRLFHSIRCEKDAKKFGLLAYNIIQVVKSSSMEQLNFIADNILNCNSAEEMVKRFTESIGLEDNYKIYNDKLKNRVNTRKARQRVAV